MVVVVVVLAKLPLVLHHFKLKLGMHDPWCLFKNSMHSGCVEVVVAAEMAPTADGGGEGDGW